ncbi:FtsX-like permease family protein [Fulvivirga sp. M361]|uniref:FtsX-like permease family protein n=1 Tax=Fulvivirga sp. M361 TaxID=2594266 RepID=UPI00117B2842|nr:FtsX-like permease family protein [Fulvivirga sp. M361]TRX57583.1 FtsX-like permease family protein [Fulvivirga sp. M361]
MFRNIIKIGFRSFLKNKSHTLINIVGLSLGITSALVIFMIIRFDLSFDNYHDDVDRIYRLVVEEELNGEIDPDTGVPFPMHLSFKQDFSDVEFFTYVDNNIGDPIISFERHGAEVKLQEDDLTTAYVMPDYFHIFKYQFIHGSPDKALQNPHAVVISRSLAEKYYSDPLSAMGETFTVNSNFEVTVTGVVEDVPDNTDIPFNILFSFETNKNRMWDSWTATSSSVQCYAKLHKGIDPQVFDGKIASYLQDHKKEGERISKSTLLLQPLAEVHFNTDYPPFTGRVITSDEILILVIIGVLLLVAASINFINLNTAQAVKRSKEIGIRKVLGSGRTHLALQFLGETLLITLISTVISLGLAELLLLKTEVVIGYSLPPTVYDLQLFAALIVMILVVSLLSGLYPAIILSRYKVISALKNKINAGYRNGLSLRRSLIVVQLLISQVLIVAVIVVSQQLRHFINAPTGVDMAGLVEFRVPEPGKERLETFKTNLKAISGIEQVTFSNTGTTSESVWGGKARYNNGNGPVNQSMQIKLIDETYLDTYDIELLAGRNIGFDTVRQFLINEMSVTALGIESYEEAIGEKFDIWGKEGTIVGVVKNFNTTSLHNAMEPVVMWTQPKSHYLGAVKMLPGNWPDNITRIKSEWERLFPDYIFSYGFLDDEIARLYENEQRTSRTAMVFAAVAIFIGAIGLFGLMSYLVNTRTKEIGVRKVLGASIGQVIQLLSSDFVKLVGVAFLIAVPVSWYFMDRWLEDFASRIEISYWIFLLALGCSLVITLLTVGLKSFKASIINPIEVLKDE